MAILADLQQVSARLSGRSLFEDLSLTISSGDRIGIVGINGTGKSTLLRVIAGVSAPDSGSVLRGRDSSVGYLEQEPVLPTGTVRSAVGEGWESLAILDRVGLSSLVDRDVSELSGGQSKRLALAQTLARPVDLLVLDEPTNHLDLAAVDWLEARLASFRGGVVIVSHDRHLLDRVVNRMVELDRGHAYLHSGGYGSYLDAEAQREERAIADEATRANLAKRELAWLRRGAPARTRKPRARIEAAVKLIDTAKPAPARASDMEIRFGTPRLGDKVITVERVSFSYPGSDTTTLRDVFVDLDPRDRLGIVGLNGSGKTTLLDLLAGVKKASDGAIDVGSTVVVGYYDQHGVDLDPNARVRDLVAGKARIPGSPEDNALMERFWFTKDLPFARVATLSGGERRRLQLLLVLARRPNVVLLDEPTNDLDLDTLRVIEDFFDDWPGALVVASHDRTFLNRTADRLIAVNAEGTVTPVAGGVESYLEHLSRERERGTTKTSTSPSSHVHASRSATPKQRSMSTLGRLLRDLEKSIARLTKERDGILASMDVSSDYRELANLGRTFEEVQDRLAAAEQEWLEIAQEAELRE